ncbi:MULTISPECIES: carbohydrate kinase [Brucella]|uniref:Fructokinase n=1 Tax=Ochrobactrum soli TaxID=2448455 RepID=A0A2P9HJD0_9HYPH|nr:MULTISPECIES: carbohydrate kinase [Brucella]RRD27845.1 carbohydrate kinase [Brucellaceae bacterium VT-16-1752]WHT41300.1 carbohydrate kinase [Ochrobactrum sp. SSR]MDX4075408.1 carbohydrate kinase [Brucella sp. NBRC 113783]WHS32212.1 carbohydrate kinase [Brucella sp. NM4]SPL64256.1 Fructokinase [[Ochrobactrum] soli]
MILCCGEALIDMLPREAATGETAFVPFAGGSVFNSAIALGRLGVPTGFFSGISSDFFGEVLRDTLARSNVDYSFAAISDRPTTLAFVRLVDGQARYAFYDENTAGRMLSESDMPFVDESIDAMLFGCISLISEPCGSVYEALMTREAKKRVMFLDPNIRAGFITDREKHLARMKRMIALADIVKLSDEDLNWFGEHGSHDEIAAEWLKLGPKLIVITKGAHGADAYTAHATVRVPGVKVDVVDTVGAGDTVNAGILVSLHNQGLLNKAAIATLNDDQIHASVALGVRAAAVTVSRAGANPPWAAEMRD